MGRARRLAPLGIALAGLLAAAPSHASEVGATDPAAGAIRFYQRHLSSLRHYRCRFTPSCSQYAAEAIARHGLVEGSALAADRLMRCNTSSESRYPRDTQGLLLDPVDGPPASPATVRVPDWLRSDPATGAIPIAAGVEPGRRERMHEALDFAHTLAGRGDCERSSAEYQRAGSLADTAAADGWAYVRIGQCYLHSSQWYLADRAFLIAAMLTSDPARRVEIGFAAATSRFDAGAFVACADLLADSAMRNPAASGIAAAAFPPPAGFERGNAITDGRVPALAGLCAMARGDWAGSKRSFLEAARTMSDEGTRTRVLRLAESADRGGRLPRRSSALAGLLSAVVPGSGQAYTGHVRDGVRHLLFNAALFYTVASLASHDQVPGAVIVGSVAMPFYTGGILGARASARRFDHDQRMRLLARAIDDTSR